MAANEKFILEFVTKGVEGIDRAKDKIEGVNRAVGGLATALLGVSFAGFISGALQAADRISDFSDATNISIASLKGLEAAMNAAGGNGKNLERAINQLYAAMETANSGSLQARDAFAKVGVSLGDLKNLSEADILQKTLEGLAQMPAGAERSAVATQLLSKAFRSIDPKTLLEALDPAKYAASEEATKKAAEAQQRLEESFKSLQEGAINALEPILNLMGEAKLTAEAATKIVQGLGIAFAVLFGAQAVASISAAVSAILKLNTALKGTAVVQAGLTALQGPKGWAILAGAGVAATAAMYGLNKMLEETESKGEAAKDAVAGVAAAAGVPTTPGRIQQATPQTGAAGRNQDLDARQKAAIESQRRIAAGQLEIDKLTALQGASEIERIRLEAAAEIGRAEIEIKGKENLSKAQKDAEYAQKRKEIETKATLDIARVEQDQRAQLLQQRVGYQDQISQMLGYEKSETQKVNDLIAQQPEKYKEIGDQMRANAAMHDANLTYIRKFNAEQERFKQLFAEGFKIGIDFANAQEKITMEAERRQKLEAATNQLQRDAINEEYNARIKISDLIAQDVNQEKLRAALLSDANGDATGEQIQLIVDHIQKIQMLQDQEKILSEQRLKYAKEEYDRQSTFEYGWDQAYKKYAESAKNAADQARTYFDTFTRGFEDAIVRFVQTGKLSFKDLANTIIAEFARIQAKKMAVGLFGGSSGGGILGSLLPGIFGNQFTPGSSSFVGPMPQGAGGGIFSGIGKIFGFANGGQPPVGRPSLVGERGPELFIPRSAGTIIPNNQTMAALSGGGGTTVTYNIQAVDASSFRSLVARDPQFIYSVTERGRRSQPTRSR